MFQTIAQYTLTTPPSSVLAQKFCKCFMLSKYIHVQCTPAKQTQPKQLTYFIDASATCANFVMGEWETFQIRKQVRVRNDYVHPSTHPYMPVFWKKKKEKLNSIGNIDWNIITIILVVELYKYVAIMPLGWNSISEKFHQIKFQSWNFRWIHFNIVNHIWLIAIGSLVDSYGHRKQYSVNAHTHTH